MNSSAGATTWGAGDYPLMAEQLKPAALASVGAAAVGPEDRVLDVATGTGNAALLAAERGGQVVGIDLEPALLRLADERARIAGSRVGWLTGEMTALPLPHESADVIISVFGVMYTGDHGAASRELARVAAPGARLVLASWTPGSVMPAMGQVLSSYLPPPPPSTGPPSRWGDRAALTALLEPCGFRLGSSSIRGVTLRFADAMAGADFLVRTAGHVMCQRDHLMAEHRWHDLRVDLSRFVYERAERVGDRLDLALDYLLASATKP